MRKISRKRNKISTSALSFLLFFAIFVPFLLSAVTVSYASSAAAAPTGNIGGFLNGSTDGTFPPKTLADINKTAQEAEKNSTASAAEKEVANTDKKMQENEEEKKKQRAADGASLSSWLSGHLDSSIYSNGDNEAFSISDNEGEEKDPGIIEGLLIDLFLPIGEWLQTKMNNIGMSLDAVVLGRVGGHGVAWNGYRVSLFTFELRPGNPYGVIASAVYGTIRGILYIVIALIVFAKLVMAAYKGGSTKALGALKEALTSYIVAVMMLTLMPYVFDILLYVRDVILYAVTSGLGANILNLDISKLSIVDMFKEIAPKSIMNTFMYLGTILLTLWFAMTYVGLAMSYIIYFFAFPFVCMNMQFDKNALGEWWKQMLYSMLVPVADIVLLFIPLAFGSLGTSVSVQVLQFLICCMLIPARAQLRIAMGIRTNMGMEMAGIATMMGAASLARSAVGTAARVGAGIAGAASDHKMSKMYGEMTSNEHAQMQEYTDMYNRENGYGSTYDEASGKFVPGEKEVAGVDSLSTGIAGLSKMSGLPLGAIDSEGAYNDDADHIMPDALGGRGGAGGGIGGADQSILDKYANMSNFESPEFRGISADRKAELYKQRSRRRAAKALTTAVGGAIGAGAGLGASTFLSMGTKAQMTGLGMGAGAGIGSAVPGIAAGAASGAAAAGKVAKKGVSAASTGVYQMATIAQAGMSRYANSFGQSPEAEAAFADNMSAISASTEQSLDINEYIKQETSPDNADLGAYMDTVYDDIMSNSGEYENVESMRQAMSDQCVSHVMDRLEPRFVSNVKGIEKADPEVADTLLNNQRQQSKKRLTDEFSPANIAKYGNGKYTFR